MSDKKALKNIKKEEIIDHYLKNPEDRVDCFARIYAELTDEEIQEARQKAMSGNDVDFINLQKAIEQMQLMQQSLDYIANDSNFFQDQGSMQELAQSLFAKFEEESYVEEAQESSLVQFIFHVKRNDHLYIDLSMIPLLIINRKKSEDQSSEESSEKENQLTQKRILTLYTIQQLRSKESLSVGSWLKVIGYTLLAAVTLGALAALYKTPAAYARELKREEQKLPTSSRSLVVDADCNVNSQEPTSFFKGNWESTLDKYKDRKDRDSAVNSHLEPRPTVFVKNNDKSSNVNFLIIYTKNHQIDQFAKMRSCSNTVGFTKDKSGHESDAETFRQEASSKLNLGSNKLS